MQLQEGDTVRLAASVTMAEFGLALSDDEIPSSPPQLGDSRL